MPRQREFNFGGGDRKDGYGEWVAVRRLATAEAAQKLNLPVGRVVEVWLFGSIRLRGELKLRRELLFVEESQVKNLPLEVDGVPFTYAEIEACAALD